MIPNSSFIWDNIKYLWYLQFPWRFFTFTNIFISSLSAFGLFFLLKIFDKASILRRLTQLSIIFLCLFVVYKYSVYFKPQKYLNTDDAIRTTFEEISWRISNTSFEFSPKGVKTKKSKLNTSIFDIEKKDVTEDTYKVLSGKAEVKINKNLFQLKEFEINAKTPVKFQLNTFNFPGWKAFIVSSNQQNKELKITSSSNYKLININLKSGRYIVRFIFLSTMVRTVSEILTLITLLFIIFSIIKSHSKSQ